MKPALQECHVACGGRDQTIDGIHFNWKGGAYHCSQAFSPFESICFYAADDFPGADAFREIIHPCSIRPVTSHHVLEDNPNPPGVVTYADLPGASTQVPVSTKVHQMLEGKLQQCEEGVLNIVAFGNPLPMHDREIENAVRGSDYLGVTFWTDKRGVRHFGKYVFQRDRKAPFVPAQCLSNTEEAAQFIAPFKKMSAVWYTRLGWFAKNKVIPNPNACHSLPLELVEAFSDPTPPPSEVADRPTNVRTPSTEPSDDSDQEVDIVWYEVADNYVQVCGTVADGRSVLALLEQAGQSMDELRKKVEQFWSEPSRGEKEAKSFSPTNEEMAMTFVIDCGGIEQANACLDAYEAESNSQLDE